MLIHNIMSHTYSSLSVQAFALFQSFNCKYEDFFFILVLWLAHTIQIHMACFTAEQAVPTNEVHHCLEMASS